MSQLEEKQEQLNLLAGYVLECRGRGNFLNSDEQQVLLNWLHIAKDFSQLIGVLDGFLPDYYQKFLSQKNPPSLTRLDRRVQKKIFQINSIQS